MRENQSNPDKPHILTIDKISCHVFENPTFFITWKLNIENWSWGHTIPRGPEDCLKWDIFQGGGWGLGGGRIKLNGPVTFYGSSLPLLIPRPLITPPLALYILLLWYIDTYLFMMTGVLGRLLFHLILDIFCTIKAAFIWFSDMIISNYWRNIVSNHRGLHLWKTWLLISAEGSSNYLENIDNINLWHHAPVREKPSPLGMRILGRFPVTLLIKGCQ